MAVCARFITNKWLLRSKTLNSILTVRTFKVPSDTRDLEKKDKNEQAIDRTNLEAIEDAINRKEVQLQEVEARLEELRKGKEKQLKEIKELEDRNDRYKVQIQEYRAKLEELMKIKEELFKQMKERFFGGK